MTISEATTKMVGAAVIVLTTACLVSVLFCFPTMWLWNWLMPALFQLPHITVFQAWGLTALAGVLFQRSSTSSK